MMSGELADCFASKKEGVGFIVDEVRSVFPEARFYGIDGSFHTARRRHSQPRTGSRPRPGSGRSTPMPCSSTSGQPRPTSSPSRSSSRLLGRSILARLQQGYLRYTGMLRTTVPAIVRAVEIGGVRHPVSSEHFAQSGDVHLALGHIGPSDYTLRTPDGGPGPREGALRRLARVVCADLEELGEDRALSIAGQVWTAQREEVTSRRGSGRGRGGPRGRGAGIGAPTFAPRSGSRAPRRPSPTRCRPTRCGRSRRGTGGDPAAHRATLLAVSLGLSAVLFLLGVPLFFVVLFLPRSPRGLSAGDGVTARDTPGADLGNRPRRPERCRIEVGIGRPRSAAVVVIGGSG